MRRCWLSYGEDASRKRNRSICRLGHSRTIYMTISLTYSYRPEIAEAAGKAGVVFETFEAGSCLCDFPMLVILSLHDLSCHV